MEGEEAGIADRANENSVEGEATGGSGRELSCEGCQGK